jgi:uncharacterized protein YggE
MPRIREIAVFALLSCSLPLALGAQVAAPSTERNPDIETVGSGERRVAPDRATVMLIVETRAPSAAVAASNNARAVAAVRDTLRRLGLESVTTTASYNVGPAYEPPRPERSGPERVGYAARSVVRVQLSQIDQVGRVIDAGLARGGTGVEGVFFEASTAEEARRAALADAATVARRDAEALARSLGGTAGPLLSVSTAGGMDPRRMNVDLSAAYSRSGTQITPSEIVIRAGVITRWRFVPGAR